MPNKLKQRTKKIRRGSDFEALSDLWLEWHVVRDSDEGLSSFNFVIKKENLKATTSYKISIPILALYHLAEKYNWLQVLRGPKHRPQDPYELVQFIQMLQQLKPED